MEYSSSSFSPTRRASSLLLS
uniref:Uncharacterized protein n=1 Tax=Musa acuminata subsp. malaccensis TaxID=214687 RepID=A0A804J8Q2_MUSAM